jgi:hypothetical protein
MTAQELLILSFFDKTVGKELDNNNLTTEMIEAGIGSNDGADVQYYNLVSQLRSKGLLVSYKDPSKITKGISRAVGQELLVLSDQALKILQRQEVKQNREALVTELEFSKLKTEYDLLANQLADYKKTKKQKFWAIAIAIITSIVAILSLIIKK